MYIYSALETVKITVCGWVSLRGDYLAIFDVFSTTIMLGVMAFRRRVFEFSLFNYFWLDIYQIRHGQAHMFML